MHILNDTDGRLHRFTTHFINKDIEQLYKRYMASHYRAYIVWCFVVLAILNTLAFISDIRLIPLSDGYILFGLRIFSYMALAVVSRLLLKGGFSCWYCRGIFVVVALMAIIPLYRYDILYHMGHQGFDFEFQLSALVLIYFICGGMIILPIMAQYIVVVATASMLIYHTAIYEPDGFLLHKTSLAIYALSTLFTVRVSLWWRRLLRSHFFHRHIKSKAMARAMAKNQVLDKMQNAFMANATAQVLVHELKTPLATAYGYAQMANNEKIENALSKMNEIMQNIRHLGQGKTHMVQLDIMGIIQRASDLWFAVCQNTKGQVKFINTLPKSDKGDILADDILTQGAIANVVRNALQVRRRGKVSITISGAVAHIIVRISNDTPRPDGLNDSIFTPMWGHDMVSPLSPDKKSDSVGIGLAFVYDVLRRIGGDITIDTTITDSTDFILTIPRYMGKNHTTKQAI